MKVLWITNILFPEAISILSNNDGELKSSGGWILGAAESLLKNKEICLCIATVSPLVKSLTKIDGKRCQYYILPQIKFNEDKMYRELWQRVNAEFKADVVHIHGTETRYGNDFIKATNNKNIAVSIQGLLSSYYRYYYADIPFSEILKNITLRDILRGTLISSKRSFRIGGIKETDTLKRVNHIIGRTSWDRALTNSINPAAQYHHCDETLRDEFYTGETWNYDKCIKHSIFVSQGTYPLKGMHQLLKAMPIILRNFPDTQIRVAGKDITIANTWKRRLLLTGYGNYLRKLIKKLNLENHITFTGNLNAYEMKQEYLNSNVFVCPSSIENSPNSLGEAQILGVPCVASYVGGVMDMMKGNEVNLYRFEEYEMLAEKICTVFTNKANNMSMQAEASKRHDKNNNSNTLYEIYKHINTNNL